MKLLVCGGRDYDDRSLLYSTLDAAVQYAGCTEIICGYDPRSKRYQGADQLAYEWALETETPCKTFPADWKQFGHWAGPRRNTQMADDKPDEAIGFPRKDGRWGPGTIDMLTKCVARGIQVHQVKREGSAEPLPPPPTQSEEP